MYTLIHCKAQVSLAKAAVVLCDLCSFLLDRCGNMSVHMTVSASAFKPMINLRPVYLIIALLNHLKSWGFFKNVKLKHSLTNLLISPALNPSCLTLATSHSGHWWTDPAPDRFDSQQGGGYEGKGMLAPPGNAVPSHPLPYSTPCVALNTWNHPSQPDVGPAAWSTHSSQLTPHAWQGKTSSGD